MQKKQVSLLIGRFTIVGILNSIFGYFCIFSLMFYGFSPETSNAAGYAFGFIFSFFSHRTLTFKSSIKVKDGILKFLISCGSAYILNYVVLIFLLKSGVNPYIAQVIAGGVYIVSSFIFMRSYAFGGSSN